MPDGATHGPQPGSRRHPLIEASTALPYAHVGRASAGLRAELRYQLGAGELADWSTLVVTGPVEIIDGLGRLWFEYRATMNVGELIEP